MPETGIEPASEKEPADNAFDAEYDDFYEHEHYWHINQGEKTVHAKRMSGKYRRIKWFTASLYLLFFLGPYVRWDGKQAILFDLPGRKFHLFGLTVWPQDIWMLSLLLMTFFFALFAVTAIAGRAFCGYLCWQTVWTDVYTWFEDKLEGPPQARRALEKAPWNARKIAIKTVKHLIFLTLSALTGITFTAYFIDVYDLWHRFLTLQGPIYIWTVPLTFLIGSYIGVAFMREQICFWLCPYARIQGVMADSETIIPTYDAKRGEPRGRIKKGAPQDESRGDCIDCNLCVAVCPVGIDIRHGLQEECITCSLCIDACDYVMGKIGKPGGLIRYMSLAEQKGKPHTPLIKRPRVIVYSTILLVILSGVIYGITHISPMNLTVIHERQPLFVRLSDGSIQNKYTLKILNKTEADMRVDVKIKGVDGAALSTTPEVIDIPAGKIKSVLALVKASPGNVRGGNSPLWFEIANAGDRRMKDEYKSSFIGPER